MQMWRRQTGLLMMADDTSLPFLSGVESSLKSIGAKFDRLTGNQLRERFPSMSFSDRTTAVYDYSGGILRADLCLSTYQVFKEQRTINAPFCVAP